MELLQIHCLNEAATVQLAETLALALRTGDLITLKGDLGAGKTTFIRALIRVASGNPVQEVPSPTFTLVQAYDGFHFGTLAHMDLYRFEEGEELEELGLDEALNTGVALIEWPERVEGFLPPPSLSITIQPGANDEERLFIISGNEKSLLEFIRSRSIREFLNLNGHKNSTRQHLVGDASTRSYETIHVGEDSDSIILMNSPAMPDGEAVHDGKPYSQIAKLAENIRAFVGIALALERQGMNTPHIFAHDLENGCLLIENLGADTILTKDGKPIEDRYLASMETLAELHEKKWNPVCPLPDGTTHTIPNFDREAMLIEVELLVDCYAPYKSGSNISNEARAEFTRIWNNLIDQLENAEKSLILRDFHSPNIIWIENANGSARTGLIDFQDALIGPVAYDVASIAQDARVGLSAELESKLVVHYCASRDSIDESAFHKAYAIMSAQRVTKVLGIFVRLSERDHKHGYLAHLPHMEDYLVRSLSHPALAEYRTWVENVMNNNTAK